MAGTSASGEKCLDGLVAFIERRGPDLMSGRTQLWLTPRALEYVAARLQRLEELEGLKRLSPVDYFRNCVTDIGDFKRLEKLAHVLQRVRHLRVFSLGYKLRDPTRVVLAPFQALETLELRGCDLSTSAWQGASVVQATLRGLSCADSLEELQHLLAPAVRISTPIRAARTGAGSRSGELANGGGAGAAVWPRLLKLACTRNCLAAMDGSLALLPALEELDLSCNNIAALANLGACRHLTRLDLSNNCLSCLTRAAQMCSGLRQLVLRSNTIRSTAGLERLSALEELDLACNLIASVHEVARISGLAALRELWLEDNPLACAPRYRMDVLACFLAPGRLLLDGKAPSHAELEAARLRGPHLEMWARLAPEGPSGAWPWGWLEDGELGRVDLGGTGTPRNGGTTVAVAAPHADGEALNPSWPVSPTASSARGSSSVASAALSAASAAASSGRTVRRNPARRIVEFLPGQPGTDGERAPPPPPLPPSDAERAAHRHSRSLPRSMMRAAGLGSPVPERSSSGGAQYYDVPQCERARSSTSPPRYRHSVLARLHETLPPGPPACAPPQDWASDGSDTEPSLASSPGSDLPSPPPPRLGPHAGPALGF
ncbi:hypothetical protein WJX81_002220 [Elliptochloris bilobata]|uniref:Uncharacterized protein n=1 Tax=Elliptochloris bilobata TaxID=381761 RepID=A0AAW1RFT3_9CHLO